MSSVNQTSTSMFYQQVIRPFVEPFFQATDYLFAKIIVLSSLIPFAISYSLFETPQRYWETLFYLMVLDLLAKNYYIYRHDDVKWSFDLLVRKTIFKGSAYIIACTTFTLMSNQWGMGTNYLQYVGYMGLCILESFSIMKWLKMIAYFIAIFQEFKKGTNIDFDNIKQAADSYAKQMDT